MTSSTKAQRLLTEGRVCVLDAEHFRVAGDHGDYVVQFVDEVLLCCDCPAWSYRARCSHTAAVALLTTCSPATPKRPGR